MIEEAKLIPMIKKAKVQFRFLELRSYKGEVYGVYEIVAPEDLIRMLPDSLPGEVSLVYSTRLEKYVIEIPISISKESLKELKKAIEEAEEEYNKLYSEIHYKMFSAFANRLM